MRAFDACFTTQWAITPDALQAILTIANREGTDAMLERALERRTARQQAVAAMDGRPLDDAKTVTMRDSVAVLAVTGPIVRYADLFAEVSGMSSVETLAKDFTRVASDPNVSGIVLNIDSPGGEVSGIDEFAAMVYAARGTKPITAYISDVGASAAYWIASAADEIVVAATGLVGSIGVVAAVRDPSKQSSRDIEFVSSQSPKKRSDPTTESGKSEIQRVVDDLASVFVAAVARHRGVSEETVVRDFGQGGLLVGQAAVTAGLADRVGSFEQVVSRLQAQTTPRLFGLRGMTASHKEPLSMASMKDRVWSMFGSMDEKEAGVEQASGQSLLPPLPAMSYAVGATPHLPAARDESDEVARLRTELAKVKAERVTADAEHFYTAQLAAAKATPGERTAIIDAYTSVAASMGDAGVSALDALYASRPAHILTTELVPVGQDATVLTNTTTTPDAQAEETRAAAADARAWGEKQNGHKREGK